VEFLFSKGCDFVLLACNTASSEALRKIQREWLPKNFPNKKVLGVLIPTAEEAVLKTKNGRIGILATPGTVRSRSFEREIKKIHRGVSVFQSPAPLLVPFIEAGEEKSPALALVIQKYLAPLIKNRVDTLVLGCTHYGILETLIRGSVGKNLCVVNEGPIVAKKLKAYFARHREIEKRITKKKKIIFYISDRTDAFQKFGSRFFGKKIQGKKVIL
jgi:glutamate racemase